MDSFSSIKLCEIIVCSRYFNSFHEQASSAMKELSVRRSNGDPFIFETWIDQEVEKLPKLSGTPDLKTVLSGMKL